MEGVMNIYRNLKGDRTIWMIVLLLAVCSVLAVYSASGMLAYQRSGSTELLLAKHFVLLLVGLGIMYTATQIHYTRYSKVAPLLILAAVPLLLYTLFFGVEVNDASEGPPCVAHLHRRAPI